VTTGSDRTLNRLSVALSFGLVIMVGGTAGYIGWPKVASAMGIKPAKPVPQPPAYLAGQKIDSPAEWYSAAPRTLVLFARESCGACQKAQPFLKSLVASLDGRAPVMMAHPAGTEAEDRRFAASIGITSDHIKVVTANMRVKATPTMVLVDQTGAILAAWEGAGKADRQKEISTTIGSLTK
jgi:hypothetical protein